MQPLATESQNCRQRRREEGNKNTAVYSKIRKNETWIEKLRRSKRPFHTETAVSDGQAVSLYKIDSFEFCFRLCEMGEWLSSTLIIAKMANTHANGFAFSAKYDLNYESGRASMYQFAYTRLKANVLVTHSLPPPSQLIQRLFYASFCRMSRARNKKKMVGNWSLAARCACGILSHLLAETHFHS